MAKDDEAVAALEVRFPSVLVPGSGRAETANVMRGIRVRDDEVVACLRSEAGRLTAVQMADLLGTMAPEGLSQGTIVMFFHRAFPEIPLRTLLDATGWSRVGDGGMSDDDFNRTLRPWIRAHDGPNDEETKGHGGEASRVVAGGSDGRSEVPEIQALVAEATNAISKRRRGCLASLELDLEAADWAESCPEVGDFLVQAHSSLKDALAVMLSDPSGELHVVIERITDAQLQSQYSWSDLRIQTFPEVMNAANYILSELVARNLLGKILAAHHRLLWKDACEHYWARYRAEMSEMRDPWDAHFLLAAVALGDYAMVVDRFERDLQFDLAAHENSSRTLSKLAYLLAKSAMGTADEAMRYGAKALLLVTQFNYLRWIAWDQEDARIDLVAVVLVTQLYQEIVGPKAESTETFFRDLSPEVVVAKMQAEVAPRTP